MLAHEVFYSGNLRLCIIILLSLLVSFRTGRGDPSYET